MGWKIVFAPQALEELEKIIRFIAQDDADAAVRFGDYLADRADEPRSVGSCVNRITSTIASSGRSR
jgi:plasmid stabilization system protein ParE